MPYWYQRDPNKEDSVNTTISSGSMTSDNKGNVSDGSGQASSQSTQSSQQRGGSTPGDTGSNYISLNKYLNTNNAGQFGQQVGDKVQDQFNQANQSMDQASKNFTQKIQDQNQTPTQSQVNAAIANPEKADKTQFQGWMNQTYQGPQSVTDDSSTYNKYYNQANQAKTQAGMLNSDAGRYTLLDSYFGKPQYSMGEKGLDSFLLQNSGLKSSDYRQKSQQLDQSAQAGMNQLQNQIGAQAKAVSDSNKNVRSAIGVDANGQVVDGQGAIGDQNRYMQNELTQANQNRSKQFNQVKYDLDNGTLTDDEMQMLGLKEGQKYYDLNLGNYLTQGQDLTLGQAVTDQDRARMQALSDLAGVTNTFAPPTATAASNPYSFNIDQFKQDAAAKDLAERQWVDNFYKNYITDYLKANPDATNAPINGQLVNQAMLDQNFKDSNQIKKKAPQNDYKYKTL